MTENDVLVSSEQKLTTTDSETDMKDQSTSNTSSNVDDGTFVSDNETEEPSDDEVLNPYNMDSFIKDYTELDGMNIVKYELYTKGTDITYDDTTGWDNFLVGLGKFGNKIKELASNFISALSNFLKNPFAWLSSGIVIVGFVLAIMLLMKNKKQSVKVEAAK